MLSKKRWLAGMTMAGILTASLTAWNQRVTHAGKMLPKVMPGAEYYFSWKHGKVYYTQTGRGTPLLLLHGIGAGVSSFEWRKLVPLLSEHYTVYTLDFLGFGKSEKPDIMYNTALYIRLIDDFLSEIVGQPTHIVTSSLSGAIACNSTIQQSDLVLSLTMISPSELDTLNKPAGKKAAWLRKALNSPVIGTTFYNSLATKASIHYQLKKNLYYNKKNVTPGVVNHYYHAAHQDGIQARRAPVSFISGLMNAPLDNELRRWAKPLFVIWGEHARTPHSELEEQYTKAKPDAKVRIINKSGIMPHDEQPDEVANAVHTFIQENVK